MRSARPGKDSILSGFPQFIPGSCSVAHRNSQRRARVRTENVDAFVIPDLNAVIASELFELGASGFGILLREQYTSEASPRGEPQHLFVLSGKAAQLQKGNSSDRQSRQRRRYLWSAGQPQELAKVLADDNNISSGDREALLHAFAREFSDYPTAVRLPPCETWRLANASHGRHERRPVPSRALERHGRT